MRSSSLSLLFWLLLLLAPCEAGTPHVDTALTYVGTRETHGNNRSPVIDRWNRAVGAPLGSPYCASGVSDWIRAGRLRHPRLRSASSRAFTRATDCEVFTAAQVLRGEVKVRKGDIIVWIRAGGGHIGLAAEDWPHTQGKVIEANTAPPNGQGSQWNGDGIWVKVRRITPYTAFRITHIIRPRS
jgi:hypothetical protein